MIMERKLITKKDAVILAVIVFISAAVFLLSSFLRTDGDRALISVDGKVIKEIRLSSVSEETKISLENGVVITAQDGKIRFSESNCKDKICIKTGEISKSGEAAVCAPNKTVIEIKGADEAVNIITY